MINPRTWLSLLRFPQWSKNAVVFAALVFGDPQVAHAAVRTIIAFLAFCLVSSAGYILNDLIDADLDRLHPAKRHRPIASGAVAPAVATAISALLLLSGLGAAFAVSMDVLVVLAGYALLSLAYSLRLKQIVLVDALAIALGFLLRAVAGAAAVEVPVSAWLMLCTVLLALFLAFAKRRSELVRLGENAASHRPVLAGYSLPMLNWLLIATAGATIAAYTLYSLTSSSVPSNGAMLLSALFVAFAVARYLLLVFRRGEGGNPELLLWRDWPLLVAIIGWAIAVVIVLAGA